MSNELKEFGMKRIFLGIDKGNPQSTHFWKKNGFHMIRDVAREGGVLNCITWIYRKEF